MKGSALHKTQDFRTPRPDQLMSYHLKVSE